MIVLLIFDFLQRRRRFDVDRDVGLDVLHVLLRMMIDEICIIFRDELALRTFDHCFVFDSWLRTRSLKSIAGSAVENVLIEFHA